MAGKQISGDGVPPSLAGMSKTQLFEIMSQMKALIEQNKQQARQILIQNPVLTRALFQAQIMLGMVQSPQASPAIPSTASQIPNPQPSPVPSQQSNVQPVKPSVISNQQSNIQPGSSFPGQTGQNQIRKHQQPNQNPNQKLNQMAPNPHAQPIPVNPHPQPTPSRPLQPQQKQQPKAHLGGQSTQMSVPHSSQVHNPTQLPQHSVSQPPSLHQPSMPSLSTPQSQQPMQNSGNQYIPLQQPLQPPLPPQQRPPMPGFPHQGHAQMGQNNMGFQHPSGPQMHHSQHMFHSSAKPHGGMGPSFQQGQMPHPNQSLPQPLYQGQGGNPHMGIDFNQSGSSSRQPDRGGSNWTPGLQENTIGQFQGQSSFPGQVGPSNQPPPRPASLAPDLEKQLLQQVMSLTPEQINQLPPEQRNQVLQLQQILRQ